MPDPLPVAIVIHDTRDVAVHAHPAREVTVTEPDPPVAATSAVDGAIARELSAWDLVERIRGQEGTTVVLRIRRASSGEIAELVIPRARVRPPRGS